MRLPADGSQKPDLFGVCCREVQDCGKQFKLVRHRFDWFVRHGVMLGDGTGRGRLPDFCQLLIPRTAANIPIMSTERTALEHLSEGREALDREICRLTAALADLDVLIDQLSNRSTVDGAAPDGFRSEAFHTVLSEEFGNRRTSAETESTARTGPVPPPVVTRDPARNGSRAQPPNGEPRSIRLRILDMLGEQDRAYPLSEIIERIHTDGIAAHDDAIRSITIKLMKEGMVERVGRGRYQLAASQRKPPGEPANPAIQTPPLNLSAPWVSPPD